MGRSQERHRPRDTAGDDGATTTHGIIRSDDIRIRNHDSHWGYDLDVEVVGGETTFQKRYYLQPGQIEGESYVLPSGEYEIRATLDNSHTERLRCRIDSAPAHTAVIEVGNGLISLTQGLR